METLEQAKRNVADLHWLATLLTGSPETAADVTFQHVEPADGASPVFSTWIHAWSRRNVIARALAAVREDLARSARWTDARAADKGELPPRSWTLNKATTKSDLEQALLQIDVFPRAAVLLLAFERVPLKDAAILLDSDPELVRKALAVGTRDLTINLARMQDGAPAAGPSKPLRRGSSANREDHHVRSTEIAP